MTFKTRILHTDKDNFRETVGEAAEMIKKGGTVAFPTETVYGLGADAVNPAAVKAVFRAKGRPADNPLIVHVASKEQCEELASTIPEKAYTLIDRFWPGPLTLILERKQIVPDITTGGLDTVALRMPDNRIAMELIRISGRPLAAPSANLSGRPSPTTAEHVIADLDGRIDAIIDGGAVRVGVESTVIDMTSEPPAILRPGIVSRNDIEREIGRICIGYEDKIHQDIEKVRSPGMKYTHYSPDAIVILLEGSNEMVISKIQEMLYDFRSRGAKVGLLLTGESNEVLEGDEEFLLGKKDRPSELAFNLFSGLRYLDEKKVDVILADGSFSHSGVGAAVRNRLRKAAEMIIKM
ncbi:L-threonylcarbamoyladenylate synthase [Methanolobus halotolerans]|uniref:Threonylcarbamoyl-AMP synthase n=1 Tax=Methanolobus halotolerans TaxID=2052935 RepID=A0A4E0QQK8_9EURY|nr:L-threonylcarbamoyladenylate synthase [Methanolobus halotolerans]TGC07925.1 threonylcarbamoyl-AMP synthase [Methanolobus halotolerans]